MSQSSDNPKPPLELSPSTIDAWQKILSAVPVPQPAPDLLTRTLAAVQSERMKLPASSPIQNQKSRIENPRRPRWLADVAAMFVAACLLVACIIPAVAHARYSYRRTLCATNLSFIATGIGQYASVWHGQLPSLATPQNHNWLNPDAAPVQGGHTNTANLFPLLAAAYITPPRLICPGRNLPPNTAATLDTNDIPDCDYSYVNLFGPIRPTWDHYPSTIILADRNPLFCRHPAINPEANSPNHEGNGNYILRADGHVTWEISPDIGPNHDNIWTIATGPGPSQRLLTYTGTETPTSPNDTFLAP